MVALVILVYKHRIDSTFTLSTKLKFYVFLHFISFNLLYRCGYFVLKLSAYIRGFMVRDTVKLLECNLSVKYM